MSSLRGFAGGSAAVFLALTIAGTLPAGQSGAPTDVVFVSESYLRCRILDASELAYPLLGRAKIPGRVVLTVIVEKDGRAGEVRPVTGHPLLDDAAEAYVRSLRFEPYGGPRGPKRMEGYFTVIFDLVKNNPVLGQDVPVVCVRDDGSYRVGSRVLSPAQLVAFLDASSVTETKKTIHLSPESQIRLKNAMDLLKKYSTTICIHSDGSRE